MKPKRRHFWANFRSLLEGLRDVDESGESVGRVHDVMSVDLEALARTPLFRAKRARALRELLRAHQCLAAVATLGEALSDPNGGWAVQQSLRQLKKRFSATAMMEITVCGAVPPYNQPCKRLQRFLFHRMVRPSPSRGARF